MPHYCGQCGRETFFEGLCDNCKAHCDELEANTRRAAEAAEAESAAEWARVEMEEEREERREAKRLEKRRRSIAHGILDLSRRIDELLPEDQAAPDQVRATLTQITGINRDLEDWDILLGVDSHGIELAYSSLRRRVVPSLLAVWKKRKELQPSPERLVKEFANGFLYPDIVEAVGGRRRIEAAKGRLETAQSEHRSNDSEAARLAAESAQSRLVAILAGAGAGGAIIVLPMLSFGFGLAVIVALGALGFAGYRWMESDKCLKASQKRKRESYTYKSKIDEAEQALAEEQRQLNGLGDRQLCQLLGQITQGSDSTDVAPASLPPPIPSTTDYQQNVAVASNVSCPHCKGLIASDPALAGQTVACPHCQRQLIMP